MANLDRLDSISAPFTFPTELFEHTVDQLDRVDLALLASISRHACFLARVRLYRRVVFSSTTPSRTVILFMDTLRKHDALAQLVVQLELDWAHQEPIAAQELLHGQMQIICTFRSLPFRQTDITPVLPFMINLEYLSFSPSIRLLLPVDEAEHPNFAMTKLKSLHVYLRLMNHTSSVSLLLLVAKQTLLAELSVAHFPNELVDILQAIPTLHTLRISGDNHSAYRSFWDVVPAATNGGSLWSIRRLDLCSGNIMQHGGQRNQLFRLLPNLQQLNVLSFPDELATPHLSPEVITVPMRLVRFGMIFCPDVLSMWSRSPLDALELLAKLFPGLEQLDMLCPHVEHENLGLNLVKSNGDHLMDFVAPKMARLKVMTMAGQAWTRFHIGHGAESFACAPATAKEDPPCLPVHMFRSSIPRSW